MNDHVLEEGLSKMKQAVDATAADYQRVRTGRAHPSVLEKITVSYYGTETPVNQVANVSIPEPRQLMLTPYEKHLLGDIEKAILRSDLGITPTNDGQNIRIVFPQMTEERRKDLVKQVHARGEEGIVSVRNARRDILDKYKSMQKAGEITEDDLKASEKQVQELTDKYVAEIHKLTEKKDAELMEI